MVPKNDPGCGWLNLLPPRTAMPALNQDLDCPWVIIGAGYTGLAAARTLALLRPNDQIVLIEAEAAGEGASARNSGYLVDSTLNDGHMSENGLSHYKQKYQLNALGVQTVANFVERYQVDCDWNASGKYHATALAKNEAKLRTFSRTLDDCDIANTLMEAPALRTRLGTEFYRMAVHTAGGVMLQPAKLARAMIEALPANVSLYEQSPVLNWTRSGSRHQLTTAKGRINADHLLVCTNGFIPSLGLKRDRVFPLTLTASLTRQLTEAEFQSLGSPQEWGLLSAQAMGATVRLTGDRRIMIRNTAEALWSVNMTASQLALRVQGHNDGLRKRFPTLPSNLIEHSWSGITCISANSANLFEQLSPTLSVAGCYNGGGIGLATLFGEQLAYQAIGERTDEMDRIQQRPTPTWLPPNPFLTLGIKTRLVKDRYFGRLER